MKNDEFIKMVNDDIERCNEVLKTKQGVGPLFNELMGKYSNVSNNFPTIETYPLFLNRHTEVLIDNIQIIQGFLKSYSINNCEDYRFDDTKTSGINVITNISNSNENYVIIDTFADVKNKIENMTSLQDSEIEEILTKIDELEEIVNSSERKSKKWEKAKNIIKWVADKGMDVGLTVLPIILNLGK